VNVRRHLNADQNIATTAQRLPCKRLREDPHNENSELVATDLRQSGPISTMALSADKIWPCTTHDPTGWQTGRETPLPQGVELHAINWHKLASRRRISRSKVSGPLSTSNANFCCTGKIVSITIHIFIEKKIIFNFT